MTGSPRLPGGARQTARPLATAWPAIVAYAVGFVLTFAADVALILVVGVARAHAGGGGVADEAQRYALSAPGLMAQAALSACVFVAVAFVAARREDGDAASRLRLRRARASLVGWAAAVVGLLGVTIACGEATELLGLNRGDVMTAMTEGMRAPGPARFALAVLAIGVAPGLAEETFFRGLLQPRLVAAWGRIGGVVGSSLAFGLIHVDPVHSTLAFVAGLFLGFAAERLGGIRPTMAAHAVNNSLFLTLAAVHGDDLPSNAVRAVALVVGIVLCAGSTAVLASRRAVLGDPGAAAVSATRAREGAG